MNRLLYFIGCLSVLSGVSIILYLRIIGIDLTECQLLIKYVGYWALSVLIIILGILLVETYKI